MSRFKPQVSYEVWDKNQFSNTNKVTTEFDSYAKLKGRMTAILNKANDGTAFVVRSRRGEWGEWFEHWFMDDSGKPMIVKEGWS